MTWLHGALQLLGAIGVLVGVFLLLGLGWALVAGGVTLAGVSITTEYATARARRVIAGAS